MGHKRGAKNLWIDGRIYEAFKHRLTEEGWTWGMTKKLESLLESYVRDATKPLNGPSQNYDLTGADVRHISPKLPVEHKRPSRRVKGA